MCGTVGSVGRLLQLVLVVRFNYEIPTTDHFVPRWRPFLFPLPLPLTYALSTRITHPLYLGNALNYLKYSLSGNWWHLSSFASLLAFHICGNASQKTLLSCQWCRSRSGIQAYLLWEIIYFCCKYVYIALGLFCYTN